MGMRHGKKGLLHGSCQRRLWLHLVPARERLWLYKPDGAVPDRCFAQGKSWSPNGSVSCMLQEYGYQQHWSGYDRGTRDKTSRMGEAKGGGERYIMSILYTQIMVSMGHIVLLRLPLVLDTVGRFKASHTTIVDKQFSTFQNFGLPVNL